MIVLLVPALMVLVYNKSFLNTFFTPIKNFLYSSFFSFLMLLEILALIGFLLSCYALYVKWRSSKSKKYHPLCDIAKNISCTKAFASTFGSLAFLPNAFYGSLFYALVFFLALANKEHIIFYLAIIACMSSIFLAYLSYFKQKNFCLVCTSIYILNFLLLFLSW